MAVCRRSQQKFLLLTICAFTLSCLLLPKLTCGQDSELAAQANNLIQTAVNAQNAGDFPVAAKLWEQLIAEHPENSLIGQAHHNLGICYVQTGDLQKATEALKTSLSTLPKSETDKLARSYLFLGFAQGRIGKDIGAKGRPGRISQMADDRDADTGAVANTIPRFRRTGSSLLFSGRGL